MYAFNLNTPRKNRLPFIGIGVFLWCLFSSLAWGFVDVPKLESRVTDLTGTLDQTQTQVLSNKLADFESKKGSQIAILIVPTTQPETIEEYGIKVLDLWRIGRKGVDDGLILLIAKDDHKLRLEVGYGLEGVIPDAVAKRIISETITPLFKTGDFVGGINAGVDQIIGLIDGEQLPPPVQKEHESTEGTFVFLLFGGLFAGSLLSSMLGRVTGGLLAGLGSMALASLLLGFGIAAIFVGIMVFFLITSRGGGGGPWSNGGGGYYGGGSWGGGGGSWSGGGGSGGGGGASGSW